MRTMIIEVEGWTGEPEAWSDFWALCRERPELERAKCIQSSASPLHAARIHLMGMSSRGEGQVILCTPLPRDSDGVRDESAVGHLIAAEGFRVGADEP